MRAESIPYTGGIHSARIRNMRLCGIPENSTHGFMYSCYCIHWLFVIPESVHTPCPLFLKVLTLLCPSGVFITCFVLHSCGGGGDKEISLKMRGDLQADLYGEE